MACLFGLGTHDAQYRAEDLFLVDTHVLRDVVEQARAQEEAVFVTFDDEVAAVDDEVGAFLDAEVDVAANLVVMRLVTSGPMSFDVSMPLPTFMSASVP